MKLKAVQAGEPDGSSIDAQAETYKISLVQALNWYNSERDYKDARKYLSDWAKKNNKKVFATLEEVDQSAIPVTYGWLARMLTNGAKLAAHEMESFDRFLSSLQPKVKPAPKASAAPRVSVQDAVKEKSLLILGELEALFDELTSGKLQKNFTLNSWLQKNEIPVIYMPAIQLWLQKKMGEYVTVYKAFTAKKEVLDKENLAQIKEGYSCFTINEVKSFLVFCKNSLAEIESYAAAKKANRAPRKKKVVAPGIQIKSLKYLKKYEELGLDSISPVDVVGAQQLWIYNTKYRKLGVYKSDTHQGLQVKGTTIQGYVPEESVQKTLRKPEDVLKTVLEGGKVTLRRVLENVKAKEQPLNGRINADTILLRVIR